MSQKISEGFENIKIEDLVITFDDKVHVVDAVQRTSGLVFRTCPYLPPYVSYVWDYNGSFYLDQKNI